MTPWLVYGATGYTAALVVEEAVRRGHRPVLAGRSPERLAPLAARFGLETRVAALDDRAALARALAGVSLVFHAAGPYVHTAAPMLDACLAARVPYVDITGELPVFQDVFARDAAARAAGIALLPGAGFDVVPSDCLALLVAQALPGARRLEIAVQGIGSPSRGTLKSVIEALPRGSFVRRGGVLVPQPMGRGAREVPMPGGRRRLAMPMPIGDLETAARTTGIGDITCYLVLAGRQGRVLARLAPALPFVGRPRLVRRALAALVDRGPTGPSSEARARGRCYVWARADDERGGEAQAWLETAEGYDFTARAVVLAVERLLAEPRVGALTPAGAFGAEFALQVPGTRRLDA